MEWYGSVLYRGFKNAKMALKMKRNVKKMNIIYFNYEEQTGGPSGITDYLLHKVNDQVREN